MSLFADEAGENKAESERVSESENDAEKSYSVEEYQKEFKESYLKDAEDEGEQTFEELRANTDSRWDELVTSAPVTSEEVRSRKERGLQHWADGKLDEALDDLLWCLDLSYKVFEQGRPLLPKFVLGDLVRLADEYPPAKKALIERRDRVKSYILASSPSTILSDTGTIYRLTTLNTALSQIHDTLEFAKLLKSKGPEYGMLLDLIIPENIHWYVERRLYKELDELMNIRLVFDRKLLVSKIYAAEESARTGKPVDKNISDYYNLRKEIVVYYQILLGAGKVNEARYIANALIEDVDGPQVYLELSAAAYRSGNPSQENVDQARKAVESDPDNATYVASLAMLLHATGHSKEATELTRSALDQATEPIDKELLSLVLARISRSD